MKYEKPRLQPLYSEFAELGCQSGSNPSPLGCECVAGTKPVIKPGGGCNDGCYADNHCHNGTTAGSFGMPQGCSQGLAAIGPCLAGNVAQMPACVSGSQYIHCAAGAWPGQAPAKGGCKNGGSASGCATGTTPNQ